MENTSGYILVLFRNEYICNKSTSKIIFIYSLIKIEKWEIESPIILVGLSVEI